MGIEDETAALVEDGTTSGIYGSGFEASVLYPCSHPDEQWWVTTSVEFQERYATFRRSKDNMRMAVRSFVFARMGGDLTASGNFGHLGAYPREFAVTKLLDMRIVEGTPGSDTEAWVRGACEELGRSD